jgi:hypothetical protein
MRRPAYLIGAAMCYGSSEYYVVSCLECGDSLNLPVKVCRPRVEAIRAAEVKLWRHESVGDRWLCPACILAESFGLKGRDMTGRDLVLDRLPAKFIDKHFMELAAWFSGQKMSKSVRLNWPEDRPDVSHVANRRALIRVEGEERIAVLPEGDYDSEILTRYADAWIAHERRLIEARAA